MKSIVVDKGLEGSSPIGHPKEEAKRLDNTVSSKKQVRQLLAHQSGKSSGEAQLLSLMNKQVKVHTSGKRWYVSYYSKSAAGNNDRHRVYGGVNEEKDLTKRMSKILQLQADIFATLQGGDDYLDKPYEQAVNIYKASQQMVNKKKKYLKENSTKTIEFHIGVFQKWLLQTNSESKHPSEIKRIDIANYRNWLLLKGISNRSVNNNLSEVRALFNYLIKENDGLYKNPCTYLDALPSRSETHIAYTDDECQKILDHLKEKDPYILFYIKFVAFAYLRTGEARSLKIGDIDLEQKKITLTATNSKGNKRVQRLIQDNFIDEFTKRNLQQYPKDYYVFSIGNSPGPTPVGKTYFCKRFRKVKKFFSLSEKHTVYGFRHTTVSQLCRSGVAWHKIMLLTGHTTLTSFEKYARSILAVPIEDLSKFYTITV